MSPEQKRSYRTLITQDPFTHFGADVSWQEIGRWPASWIHLPAAGEPPFVVAYRCRFAVEQPATVRIHVSADERYELFLDGERIGRSSEHGDPRHWFYETYDLPLAAGEHMLVARVHSLGEYAIHPQMTAHPGFLLAPEDEAWVQRLGTGAAPWEAKKLGGYAFTPPVFAWATGAGQRVDGANFPWGFERGEGEGWQPVTVLEPGSSYNAIFGIPPRHRMEPATLPPMLEEPRQVGSARLVAAITADDLPAPAASEQVGPRNQRPAPRNAVMTPARTADHLPAEAQAWNDLLAGRGAVTIPPHTWRRVIVDLENYYCAYLQLTTSGGAQSEIRAHWAEALFEKPSYFAPKGNRNVIEGKFFVGIGDTFLPDGGAHRRFESLWWQAGRYVEFVVHTGSEPLTIEGLRLLETRYPLEPESTFTASDPRLTGMAPILLRGLQMCAHDTYMDCPYYERLMYVGDCRLEVLTTYVLTHDDRLPRKALRLFEISRQPSGITQSRYPTRQDQIIPPFSLWWVGMVRDYALWRGDPAFVAQMMPGVHSVIEAFQQHIREDGLLHAVEGWNFTDWVPGWPSGMPPEAMAGASGVINWHLVYTLALLADLEEMLGQPERASLTRKSAASLADAAHKAFWDEGRGLYADDRAHRRFSEHTQCLALLSGQLPPERRQRVAAGLLNAPDLARATIYFMHYLFETYRELGRIDALYERLGLWFDLEGTGFKTTFEHPEPSRSDCHGWGAHPLYHYYATLLGIRPAGLGFRRVEITPQLGPLTEARGRMVHPLGEITADFHVEGGAIHGRVALPEGVEGVLRANGMAIPLAGGTVEF